METCIHCGNTKLRKFGKINGVQQYYCVECKKCFTENSNSNRNLVVNGEKYCTTCNKFKPLSDYLYSEGKPRSRCKTCFLEKNNSRYKTYELDEEKFKTLLEFQNGKCSICDKNFKSNKLTHIDHNHINNNVRGLLCPKCNNLLGMCNDDVEVLKSAILYLLNNEKVTTGIIGSKQSQLP